MQTLTSCNYLVILWICVNRCSNGWSPKAGNTYCLDNDKRYGRYQKTGAELTSTNDRENRTTSNDYQPDKARDNHLFGEV